MRNTCMYLTSTVGLVCHGILSNLPAIYGTTIKALAWLVRIVFISHSSCLCASQPARLDFSIVLFAQYDISPNPICADNSQPTLSRGHTTKGSL